MHQLGSEIEGIVHFGVWDRDTILFLRSYGQPSSYYLYADAGDRRPLHANAMGKAMLAWAPATEVERIMSEGCERFTENTITTLAAMQRELTVVRKRGYARNDEEWCLGLRAVASPIFGARREVAAFDLHWRPSHQDVCREIRISFQTRCADAGMQISRSTGLFDVPVAYGGDQLHERDAWSN